MYAYFLYVYARICIHFSILRYEVSKSVCIHILFVDDGKADVWSLGITLLELCEGNSISYDCNTFYVLYFFRLKRFYRQTPTLQCASYESHLHYIQSTCPNFEGLGELR